MTLFSILRFLHAQGVLTTESFYDPFFGCGERFLYNGKRLRIVGGVVGQLGNYVKGAKHAVFDSPTDVAITADGDILCQAPA